MELNIGTNIRRLRLEKGMTQEQFANLLSVSTAAVSKWESQNTYPDITLLFPMASIFGVSVDVLMGYDEAKEKEDIDRILEEISKLRFLDRFDEHDKLIRGARKQYPHDYRIMNAYMWQVAGGFVDNDPAVLLENKDELTQICDCILDGCKLDNIRANAISLKAKILHAEGRTDEALELLDCLPVWPSHVMTEQLFATDTPEYRYWNKRNCYGFLDVAAIKLARITCLDPELAIEEKLARLERLAQGFDALSDAENAACFCVCTQSVLESAARILDAGNTAIENVIRIREKQIKAMEKMMRLAETDEVFKESLTRTYKSYTPIEHLINRLSTSSQPSLAKLRENAEYMKMIEKYK